MQKAHFAHRNANNAVYSPIIRGFLKTYFTLNYAEGHLFGFGFQKLGRKMFVSESFVHGQIFMDDKQFRTSGIIIKILSVHALFFFLDAFLAKQFHVHNMCKRFRGKFIICNHGCQICGQSKIRH